MTEANALVQVLLCVCREPIPGQHRLGGRTKNSDISTESCLTHAMCGHWSNQTVTRFQSMHTIMRSRYEAFAASALCTTEMPPIHYRYTSLCSRAIRLRVVCAFARPPGALRGFSSAVGHRHLRRNSEPPTRVAVNWQDGPTTRRLAASRPGIKGHLHTYILRLHHSDGGNFESLD